jgi:hypothetical protein
LFKWAFWPTAFTETLNGQRAWALTPALAGGPCAWMTKGLFAVVTSLKTDQTANAIPRGDAHRG